MAKLHNGAPAASLRGFCWTRLLQGEVGGLMLPRSSPTGACQPHSGGGKSRLLAELAAGSGLRPH
jgi:hypothetical protein